MGVVKRASSKSYKSSRRPRMLKDRLGRVEIDDDRFFTLESLGAPERVHLPVDIIERQKFSKIAESSMKKFSANEILSKKREDLKKNLKDFIDVAFPSSTNPYKHLLSSPGPISSLEKFYLANRRELKPPKYKLYFDISRNSYFYTLYFNDNVEYSDAMPIKILAKLQVAHKALMRTKRRREKSAKVRAKREKPAKELAEREKVTKEMSETTMSIVNQIKDQSQKEPYLHHQVRSNKKREPKDNDRFMKNVSNRNFFLLKEFYDESESMSKKRKGIDWNEEGTSREGNYTRIIKKIRIEKETDAVTGINDDAVNTDSFRKIAQLSCVNFKAETFTQIVDSIPENVAQESQPTDFTEYGIHWV